MDVVVLALVLSLLAPLLACDSAQIIPRMRIDGAPGDAAQDAPADTTPIDPLVCREGQLPTRPSADGDDGMERTFVFVDWQLFPPSPDFGFNLDLRCTTNEETASCTSATIVTDETGGIDNAFASRIAAAARTYFDSIGENPEEDLHALQSKGIMDLLIRIRGWNGEDEDRSVEVDLMQTVCGHLSSETDCTPGMDRPTGLTFDGTEVFYVSRESIDPFDTTEMTARVVQPAAYVTGRVLVVPIPGESVLRFPVDEGYIDVGLQDAQLTAPLPPDDVGFTINNAMISGRWGLADVRQSISYFAICPSSTDPRRALIESAINGALDVMDDPAQDNMGLACNAISAAFRMTGYRGTYGGAKNQVRLPQGCPP
jgi:hypothetical protein